MKKYAVLVAALAVVWLGLDYHTLTIQQLGENLVTYAYQGDLLSLKNSVEEGAPLDYVFYFSDEARDYGGTYFNALQAAASGGNEKIISYLLKQGMDIDAPTPQGWTPLIIAVRDGQTTAAKALIYYKADLNAQTDLGATALMMAATQKFPTEKDRQDLLTYLLKRGANPNLTDAFGHSAFYYAAALQKADAAQILHEYGAAPTEQEKQEIRKLLKGKKGASVQKIRQLLTQKPKKTQMVEEDEEREEE